MNKFCQCLWIFVLILLIINQCNANLNAKDEDGTEIHGKENDMTCQANDNNNSTCVGESTSAISHEENDKQKRHQELEAQRQKEEQRQREYKFPNCRLFLAPSTLSNKNTGLGIFTTRILKRGQPISFPDIIIQVTDYLNTERSIGSLIDQYSWDATKFGGQLEAKKVASILPGIGSIANAQSTFQKANALPYRPDVDEANVPRTTKSGAGSFTHYHNLTFFATKQIQAGAEIFVHYDIEKDSWIENRTIVDYDHHFNEDDDDDDDEYVNDIKKVKIPGRDVQWLTQNGICIDNLQPRQSKIKGAGRGAFATRFIPKGSIIAPVPLVVIADRDSLVLPERKVKKAKETKQQQEKPQQQLLLNYCFGHVNSTVLFFPTTPIVNLINHAPTSLKVGEEMVEVKTQQTQNKIQKRKNYIANAKLQWSSKSNFHSGKKMPEMLSIAQLKELGQNQKYSGLMMEYIATRDIQPNEEILFDYGPKWTTSWKNHEKKWKPVPNAKSYSPSYVMEDVAGLLRTEKEQLTHPYGLNIQISCFYQYSVYHKQRNDGIVASQSSSSTSKGVTTVKWQMDRRTFEFKNLRPCSVMDRVKLPNGQWSYKILMKNRYGLPKEEMIPKGEMHVVDSVPRGAIRFTDKMYSTDQHLPNAFRHEIGIPDEIFPKQWMDRMI